MLTVEQMALMEVNTMRCPSCGANANAAFCEYCGTKMPIERVETTAINAENVTVNNYYVQQAEQTPTSSLRRSAQSTFADSEPVLGASPKSRLITLLLCIFLGYLGAHRFYTGRYLLGVLYVFTIGIFGIGWLVDIVLAAIGKMRDRHGLQIVNW